MNVAGAWKKRNQRKSWKKKKTSEIQCNELNSHCRYYVATTKRTSFSNHYLSHSWRTPRQIVNIPFDSFAGLLFHSNSLSTALLLQPYFIAYECHNLITIWNGVLMTDICGLYSMGFTTHTHTNCVCALIWNSQMLRIDLSKHWQ